MRVFRVDEDDDPTAWPLVDRDGGRADRSSGPWRWRVGGYALADVAPPDDVVTADGDAARVAVKTSPMTSSVAGLVGHWIPGVHRSRNSNAFGPHAAVPLLTGADPVNDGEWAAIAVVLDGSGVPRELPTVCRRDDHPGFTIMVTWSDGGSDQIRLDPPDRDDPH